MAKVTYIGTPDDETSEITHRGISFVKGKAVEVDDKVAAEHFADNGTFEVDAKPKPKA